MSTTTVDRLALTDQQRDACLSVFAKAMVDPCQIDSE